MRHAYSVLIIININNKKVTAEQHLKYTEKKNKNFWPIEI